MTRLIIKTSAETSCSDLEYLEQVYRQVPVGSLVKFRGKAYMRKIPTKRNPYHFWCAVENLCDPNAAVQVLDEDGDWVTAGCEYSVVLEA